MSKQFRRIGLNYKAVECKCACGTVKVYLLYSLRRATKPTRSCGCLLKSSTKRRFTTHGESNTRLYNMWVSMRGRVNNRSLLLPNGRPNVWLGVEVAAEWDKYTDFRDWALANGYHDKATLDRIGSVKLYSPETCRWTDKETQSANSNKSNNSNNKYIGIQKARSGGTFAWKLMCKGVVIYRGAYPTEEAAAEDRNKYILGKGLPHRLNDIEVKR